MIDTDRTFSQKEVDILEDQGYEFVSIQTFGEPYPVYVVSRYNTPTSETEEGYDQERQRFV